MMKLQITQLLKLTLCVLSFVAAQSANETMGQQRPDSREPSVVAYRLTKWKTMHFDDGDTAKQHAAAVRNLGCETKTDRHGDHFDVTYRQMDWMPLSLSSDEVAHRWQDWLDGAGFESLHGHGDSHGQDEQSDSGHDHRPNGAEMIAYRLSNWKTMRFDTRSDTEQFVAIAKGLGCEFRNDQRDDRSVTVRCRNWKHAEFSSHASATSWEHWLGGCGFEAQHEHGQDHNHAH
jgi:hypothetical protein